MFWKTQNKHQTYIKQLYMFYYKRKKNTKYNNTKSVIYEPLVRVISNDSFNSYSLYSIFG